MIDLHCHMLPGIDDGPDCLEESLAMARMAVADGITHVVVTPHIHPGRWENEANQIAQKVASLRQILYHQKIALTLGYAAEVRITDRLFSQLESDFLPFYGDYQGCRVLLMEFPHSHLIPGSEKLMAWLVKQNIRPLIAHPERNKEIMANPERLEPYIKAGCLLQVTAGSLVGRFGAKAQAIAEQLLHDDVITVLATDAHNIKARAPLMKEAYDRVTQLVNEEKAQQLTLATPQAITAAQFQTAPNHE